MSSITTATMPLSVSRPKVHRLPVHGRAKKSSKAILPGFLLFWAAVLLALIVVSLSLKKTSENGMVIKAATMLPAVAVVSERIPPAGTPAVSAKAVVEPDNSSVIPTPFSDAQAAPAPSLALTQPEKNTSIIMLKDKSSVIVGQMARIPLENEQITEVKPINDVDNRGGRELLSIVGKY